MTWDHIGLAQTERLKGHSTDFTHGFLFTRHNKDYSAIDSCIVFSLAIEGAF